MQGANVNTWQDTLKQGLEEGETRAAAPTDCEEKMADAAVPTPADKKAPPKFKQRTTRTFKSKAPKPGQKGFGDDIPGMEGLGTDITVVCPWEAFGDMELSDLAKYGIV
ncbi:hypothetical protein OJAV_G00007790 [Oryzias javanicus]|uniref:3',5'-cyclic-GMP phosphodiesterase n=1 Tax=Oryzias javanicus TaxID=123683 RepID=A0A3S2PL43_ORYJA|nr:hypothetical protein OJAV_G00007790 [Oryzias javanicus]